MPGSQKLTAAGVVGVSGKPTRIYGYILISLVSGPGIVTLYNGTDTTGTKISKQVGTADSQTEVNFGPEGTFFPGGCYADIDGDVAHVNFDYCTENTL